MPDLIITGVPRSGTTLAAAVIDQAPDALCLSEPDGHVELMNGAANAEDFVTSLCREFDAVRRTILLGGAVLDRRRADGAPITNYFSAPLPDGRRETVFTTRRISRSGLSADFVLGVKHNALYAAVLPEIVRCGRFRVIAIVRDPVAVLTSWRTLDLPVSHGRLPAGEPFWPALAALGRADLDLTDKQIRICDLLLRRFAELADRIAVIPYEVFVTDPAQLLAAAGVRQTAPSQIIAAARATPSREGGDRRKAALTERIRQLISSGQVPGIARYYPHYGPQAGPPGTAVCGGLAKGWHMFEFIRKCLTAKPDTVTNQRTSEQASMPTLGGGEAFASGTPDTAPGTPGGTEMAGDSSSWLIAGRSQMAERSPQKLDIRAPLLVYAAKLEPSPEPPGRKFGPIWQYWHSGRDNAPDICQTCFASIKLRAGGREIIILDDNSVDRYIRLPPHIIAKREQITPVHFADIVLAYLLAEHGGTWIDTTVFLTGSIDHITSDVPFFAFTRPNDPLVLSSWFMHSAAGHPLMCAMRDMLTDYWKDNEVVPDYHYFHFLFECAITLHAGLRHAWEAAPFLLSGFHGFPRQLHDALGAGLSQSVFEDICRRTPVHKLSWKLPDAALADAQKLPQFVSLSRLIRDDE